MQKTRGIDEQGIGTTSGAVKEHQHAQLLIPFEHNQHKGPRIRCGSHQWLPGIRAGKAILPVGQNNLSIFQGERQYGTHLRLYARHSPGS